ncbi:Uncharacterised protein [Legionella jordanis]|nr:Uncharacterised protein [Legionella jordanis]
MLCAGIQVQDRHEFHCSLKPHLPLQDELGKGNDGIRTSNSCNSYVRRCLRIFNAIVKALSYRIFKWLRIVKIIRAGCWLSECKHLNVEYKTTRLFDEMNANESAKSACQARKMGKKKAA